MKAIFEAIKEVDMKWKELKLIESKNSSHGDRDLLEKYENQNKSNVSAGNKQLKQESEAQKEFEDALAIRKSCLQIIIVIVEFLGNAVIKNDRVVLEMKAKEVKDGLVGASPASKKASKSNI